MTRAYSKYQWSRLSIYFLFLANSFIPMTSRDWNSLPPSVFPVTYNLQSFKILIHRYLWLRPIRWNLFLFSRYRGLPRTTDVVPFWCNFFLYHYHYKKRKKWYIALRVFNFWKLILTPLKGCANFLFIRTFYVWGEVLKFYRL